MSRGAARTIDERLVDRDGGRITVVVRLPEPTNRTGSGAGWIDRLRGHAAQSQEVLEEFASGRAGVRMESQFWITNAVVLTVHTDAVSLQEVAALPGVERIHENFELEPLDRGSAGDVGTFTQGETTYGLDQINVPAVWEEFETQGSGARVAVLDTGIDPDHPDLDLAEGGWAEFDSDGNRIDSDPYDDSDHGTHVSGTVAGGDANGTHIGVAPDVKLYHGGVLTDSGMTFSAIVGGVEWAVEEDVDVINMSLGPKGDNGGYVADMIVPLQNAKAAGSYPVSACGNDGEGTSGTPANVYDAGLAVGATDANEDVTEFSSGESILTADDWSDAEQSLVEDWPDEYVVPDVAAPATASQARPRAAATRRKTERRWRARMSQASPA